MAGHSHWANIAHKKAAIDKKRGKIFSQISRKIIAAAKSGGGDPDTNLKLKYAVKAARAANMSNDQIARAIKRAVGGGEGADSLEELVYEAYAPGGAAVLIEALTDNRNRTGGDIRSILTKRGGNLGSSGSVAWQFQRMAVVRVVAAGTDEDTVMEAVLDAGAEDVESVGDHVEVRGAPDTLEALQAAVEAADLTYSSAETLYIPKDLVPLDADGARSVAGLLEAIEEHDDVENVYCNAEFPEGFDG